MELETRTLANGEVWELRGLAWHLLNESDYSPVSADIFSDYMDSVTAGEVRRLRLHLQQDHVIMADWASKYMPDRAFVLLTATHQREHARLGSIPGKY